MFATGTDSDPEMFRRKVAQKSDNVADYHQSWWDWWIESNAPTKIDKLTKESLIRRWAFGEKSFRLNTLLHLNKRFQLQLMLFVVSDN